MRRLLFLIPLLVLALVAWLVFFSGGDDPAPPPRTGASASVDDAADEASGRRDRRRTGADAADEAAVRPEGDAFQQRFPEVGQDRPQDPALGAMTGQIMIAQGRPGADAVLEAAQGGRTLARVHVQGDGRFLLKNVPPGTGYSVVARVEGYAPGGQERIGIGAGQTTELGPVYVGAAIDPNVDNRVRALVKGPGDTPIEGAQVTASTVFYGALLTLGNLEKQPGGTILHAETDAAGEAVIEPLPPGTYDVFVQAEGYTFQVRQRVTIQGDTKALYEFDLQAGLAIAGIVVTPEGEPIAHARVGGLRWGEFTAIPAVETDADGRFTLGGLRSGNYFVFAGKDDVGGKDLQNIAAGTTDLRIEVPLGGEVQLRVVDSETKAPLPRVSLRPFRKIPFAYLYAPIFEAEPAADTGLITFRIASADYGMEISGDGYALATVASVPVPSTDVVEVELEAAGIVVGRVVSRSTGAPIPGADVFVKKGGFPPSRVKDLATITDKEGAFILDRLPPRELSLWVAHVDHTETLFEGVSPQRRGESGTLPASIEFALGSGGRIEGRVLDDDMLPTAGQTMTLSSGFDVSSTRSTTTDAEGRYAFKNVPLDRKYTVSVGQFMPGRSGRSKSDVAVSESAITTVDFGSLAGGVPVTGLVSRRGEPVGNASVSLLSDDGGDTVEQTRTEADGRFRFATVAPGRYQITVNRGGRISADVVVGAEAPPEIALELPDQTISGQVVDATTSEVMSGVYIECERVVDGSGSSFSRISQAWAGNAVTGADGTFRISGVGDGSYRLRAQREGFGSEVLDVAVSEGASPAGLTIRLGGAGSVRGFVRTAAGTPISGASLTVLDDQGRAVFLVDINQSSSDGAFAADRLAPGTYSLTFRKDGYAPETASLAVSAGGVATHDFTLLAGGTIDLVVRTPEGTAVAKATVVLLDSSGKAVTKSITLDDIFSTSTDRTDANGHAVLRGIAPGAYRVRVQKGEGTSTSEPFEVFEGGTTPVELGLLVAATDRP